MKQIANGKKQNFGKAFAARKRERGSINIIAALEWFIVVLLIIFFVGSLIIVFFPDRRNNWVDVHPYPGSSQLQPQPHVLLLEKESAGIDSDVGTEEQVAP